MLVDDTIQRCFLIVTVVLIVNKAYVGICTGKTTLASTAVTLLEIHVTKCKFLPAHRLYDAAAGAVKALLQLQGVHPPLIPRAPVPVPPD